MPKEINDYMFSLIETLKSKGVAENTARNYVRNLYTLNNKKPFNSLAFLRHKNQILTALSPYADSTKRTFLASICSVLDTVKTKRGYGKLLRDYQQILADLKKEDEEKPKNVRNEKQEANWISWEEIQKIKNDLGDKVKDLAKRRQATTTERNRLLEFFLLSLFTEIPPRRNQDYQLCYVVKKYRDGDKGMPKDRNYLSLDDNEFIFHRYKTAKKYGTQKVSFADNEPLKHAVKLYLKHHPLKPARYGKNTMYPLLVKPDGSPFSSVNGITRLLHKIFKKKVRSSMLRHIYLTSKYGDKLDEMKEDSEKMAHSLGQQRDYIKNGDDEEEEKKGGGVEEVLAEIENVG